MHLPFSSLSSVDIQGPDLLQPSEIKSRSAAKKCHQFYQRTHPPPYDKSNALCLSEEKKLLTRKSLYLTKKVLQLQWE